ncbi:MAG: phospholipid carrier-dependent glycosyltransferase [bacterium]
MLKIKFKHQNFKFIKHFYKEILLILMFLLLYIPALGYSYVQPTDPVWAQRGIQFYEAFRHGDFAQTYTKYHPGVTLMWITGISYKIFYTFQKLYFGYVRDLFLYQVELYSIYSFIVKFFIAGSIFSILFYCYSIIKKHISSTFAFWVIFFIITEPFVIGNVRSIHVDALATFFMFASVISFWALQVEKFSLKKYILLTGIFTGFALLTKISSLVLFPFFIISSILVKISGKISIKVFLGTLFKAFRRNIFILFSISFVSAIIFFLFFPAMWSNPISTIQKIVSDGFLDTALNEESSQIVLGWDIATLKYRYLSYFIQIMFRTSPLVLIGFLFGLLSFVLRFFSNKKTIKPLSSNMKSLLLNSLIFIFGYYLMISISDKKIFRYILPLYPFLSVFVAYTVTKIFSTINLRTYKIKIFVIAFVILYQFLQPVSVYPNFFAYFNPLLGGIKNASKVISLNQDATGYYIVGEYLNRKLNAEEITVGCYDSGPMYAYFRGHTIKLKLIELSQEYLKDMDYILLPVQEGWQYLPKEDFRLEKVFRINNFDYWYLYKKINAD